MPALDLDQTRAQLDRFARQWRDDGLSHWAVQDRESGRLIGRLGLLRHHDWPLSSSPVEVGWSLHRDWWGKGLATEGGQAAVDCWREELPEDERLISITTAGNERSQAVMRRLGFDRRGETHWHGYDVLWFALER